MAVQKDRFNSPRAVVEVDAADYLPAIRGSRVVLRENGTFFECFPYVCPEPVLVKSCILYINGSKSAVFSPTHAYVCV
jgi:hypothetical protein